MYCESNKRIYKNQVQSANPALVNNIKRENFENQQNQSGKCFFSNATRPKTNRALVNDDINHDDLIISKIHTPSMNYNTTNYRTECPAKSAQEIANECPTIFYQDSYGAWSGLNGCNIDADTDVRFKDPRKYYRGKYRQPLCVRAFGGSFFGKGYYNVDGENLLVLDQNINKSLKSQSHLSETSYIPLSFEYLFQHSNPQRVKHIIPPQVCEGGWVRGGEDTRMELKRVCGGCFMEN